MQSKKNQEGIGMKRDSLLVRLLLLIFCCSLASLTVWKAFGSRDRALTEVSIHGLNLVQAISTYSDSIVKQGSQLLIGIVERLETEGYGPAELGRLHALVERQAKLMPQMSSVSIYDREGGLLMSTANQISSLANVRDRSYFSHHLGADSQDAFIGPPIRSRANDEWVITLSRRFNDESGRFLGVVVLSLRIENFLSLFGKLDVGQDGAIGLTFADGRLLARYPFREQDMGRDFSNSPIYKKYLVDRLSGTTSYASSLDGVERIYAFRKSENFPLVATVAMGKDEALSAWRVETALSAVVVSGLLVLVGIIGSFLISDMRRRAEAEERLINAQRDLLSSNKKLELMAMRDSLTGLANRRCFDEVLINEGRRAKRHGVPLGLLMVDIDYFKLYNDSQGHVEGDNCLKAVCQLIEQSVRRPGDMVARYGGEEIAVVMPNTDRAGAEAVAKIILNNLREKEIPHGSSPLGRVSVSIGVASAIGSQLDELNQLVESADEALYRAKAQGRDQYSF